MSQLEITPIIGLTLAKGWAQVCTNHNQQLVAALAVRGERANNLGRDLVNQISSSNPKTAAALHHLMLDLLRTVRGNSNQLQLAVSLIQDKQLVLGSYNGSILLKRTKGSQTQIGTILSSASKPKLIEGRLQLNDTMILLTQQVKQIEPSITQWLRKSKYPEVERLQNTLQEQQDSSLSALAIIKPQRPAEENGSKLNQPSSSKPTLAQKNQSPSLQTTFTATQASRFDKSQPQPTTGSTDKKSKKSKPSASAKNRFKLLKPRFKKILFNLGKAALIFKLFKKGVSWIFSKLKRIPNVFASIKKLVKPNQPADIYVGSNRTKRIMTAAAAVLILLAAAAGIFWWWRHNRQERKNEIAQAVQPALVLQTQAEQLEEQDLITARNKTEQAINTLADLKKQRQNDALAQQIIQDHLDSLKQYYQTISGDNQLEQLNLLLDLRQIQQNFIGSNLCLIDNNLFILDQDKQQLIGFNLESQQTSLLQLQTESDVRDIAAVENSLYLLSNGIYQMEAAAAAASNTEGSSAQQSAQASPQLPAPVKIKEPGDSDREAILMKGFASYLYVFNPDKRNIYRYIIDDQTLSEPIGWLTNKQGIDFGQVNAMTINGFIWLSQQDGSVFKLSKGEPVRFNLEEVDPQLSAPTDIAASPDLDYIFILEAEQSRVLVFTQEGELWKQLQSSSIAGATHLGVNAEAQKLYLLNGSLVYELDLESA